MMVAFYFLTYGKAQTAIDLLRFSFPISQENDTSLFIKGCAECIITTTHFSLSLFFLSNTRYEVGRQKILTK